MSHGYLIGIDPGLKNLGFAVLKEREGGVDLICSGTIQPSKFSQRRVHEVVACIIAAAKEADPSFKEDLSQVKSVTIERFVYYGSAVGFLEEILLLIGGLVTFFELRNTIVVTLIKAIDWKIRLAQALLLSRDFRNPGTALDKKFSFAAANVCLGFPPTTTKGHDDKFETDHEADAICLASFNYYRSLVAKHSA